MIDELIKSTSQEKTKKIEQLVLERPIRFSKPSYCTVNDKSITIYASQEWTDVIGKYKRYDISLLIKAGWKVVSIQKAFMPKDGDTDIFGVETAILEREVYE